MREGSALPGRTGLLRLFEHCLRRGGRTTPDLPVIVMLGPRGSGKTWALQYLADDCRDSVGIPYVVLDCEQDGPKSLWRLVCDLADGLHAKWPQFGRVSFPRVTLGRIAVSATDLPIDPVAANEAMVETLREAARLRQRGEAISGLATDIAQAFEFDHGIARLVGVFATMGGGAMATVERLYRTGLQWYATRCNQPHGLAALVKLNQLYHDENDRIRAERILVDAFIADLTAAFGSAAKQFHCAALLDNCDTTAAVELLSCLAGSRAASKSADPMVVVGTARTRPDLPGLSDRWLMPWEPHVPHLRQANPMPTPENATYESWTAQRGNRYEPASWWFPVLLRDLALSELSDPVPEQDRKFVHRLTAGHPWSVRRVLTPSSEPREWRLRHTVEQFTHHAKYLLGDVSAQHRTDLVRWAAASDIDSADGAHISEGGQQVASDLHAELVRRLWLVPGSKHRGPRLHPWLRRILLEEFRKLGEGEWKAVHNRLRQHSHSRQWHVDVAFHYLAVGNVADTAAYLQSKFGDLDAEHWIQEYEDITSAPRRHEPTKSPGELYDGLLLDRTQADRSDVVRNAIWSMTAARWIWADPVGDPLFTLTDTIADGFLRLAEEGTTGLARYRQEAKRYREMRPE